LAIHDASFPSRDGEDLGRGTPYARGGADFVRLAHRLGFDGIQLGPQGQTSLGNRSPYDGTVFSKSVLSLDLVGLAEDERWRSVLSLEDVNRLASSNPCGDGSRVQYRHFFEGVHALLADASARHASLVDARDPA